MKVAGRIVAPLLRLLRLLAVATGYPAGSALWPKACFDEYSKLLVHHPTDFLLGASVGLADDVISRAGQYHHNRIRQVPRRQAGG